MDDERIVQLKRIATKLALLETINLILNFGPLFVLEKKGWTGFQRMSEKCSSAITLFRNETFSLENEST